MFSFKFHDLASLRQGKTIRGLPYEKIRLHFVLMRNFNIKLQYMPKKLQFVQYTSNYRICTL